MKRHTIERRPVKYREDTAVDVVVTDTYRLSPNWDRVFLEVERVSIYPPGWLERLFGVTWESKVQRVTDYLTRKWERIERQEREALAVVGGEQP